MNKNGKGNAVIVIVALALVVIAASLVYQSGFFSQTALGSSIKQGGTTATPYISSGSTALTISGIDSQQGGTSVGSTSSIQVNGNGFSTGVTTASPGDTLDLLLVNTTAYHAVYISGHKVPASPTDVIGAKFKGNGTVTVSMFNTDNAKITSGGTGTNQTVASGGAYTMNIRLDGTDKKDTQDMTCILESSNGAKMDKAILNVPGATFVGQAKPSFYTLAGTGSALWVYDIPAIVGAQSVTGTVYVASKTGQSLTTTYLNVKCYPKEYFIESTTGKVNFAIEDASGTLKSMAIYSTQTYFT